MSQRPFATRRAALPALLIAATLTLTACSGGGDSATTPEEGPLSVYMNAIYDSEAYTQEKFDAQQLKVEELTATCMVAEGFEYEPNTSSGGMVFSSADEGEEDSGPEYGSVEFAEQYGYGIVDSPWNTVEEPTEDPTEEYVDPNQDYVSSLSESEQNAYYEALYGPQPTEEELGEDGSYEYDWTKSGCMGKAQHEVNAEDPTQQAMEDPQFTELFEAMNEMWSAAGTASDDARQQLDREWAECMADAGFSEFTSPDTAAQSLYDAQNELYSAGNGDEYVEPSKEQMKEFQTREIEVATADASCQKQTDYQAKLMEHQTELEQKFVDEHRAELDALVATYGTEKK